MAANSPLEQIFKPIDIALGKKDKKIVGSIVPIEHIYDL